MCVNITHRIYAHNKARYLYIKNIWLILVLLACFDFQTAFPPDVFCLLFVLDHCT